MLKRSDGALWRCVFTLGLGFSIAQNPAPARAAEWATCKFFSQLPDDCAGAEQKKYDNLRNYRYEEVDLFAKDVIKKFVYVSSYNTTGLNGGDETRDSAPKPLADKVDPKKIAKQYQAFAVWISPPRYWTLDWLSDRIGAVRNFGGLDAAWMGNRQARAPSPPPPIKPGAAVAPNASTAYRYTPIARTSIEGFKKGSEVYLLDDPKGRTWVLASYTNKDLPNFTVDQLPSLSGLIAPPE